MNQPEQEGGITYPAQGALHHYYLWSLDLSIHYHTISTPREAYSTNNLALHVTGTHLHLSEVKREHVKVECLATILCSFSLPVTLEFER